MKKRVRYEAVRYPALDPDGDFGYTLYQIDERTGGRKELKPPRGLGWTYEQLRAKLGEPR